MRLNRRFPFVALTLLVMALVMLLARASSSANRMYGQVLGTDQDLIAFHTSGRVTTHTVEIFRGPDANQPEMVKRLFKIEGVTEVYLYPYAITIRKTSASTWSEMRSQLESAILRYVDK